jgi:hypothetical protein
VNGGGASDLKKKLEDKNLNQDCGKFSSRRNNQATYNN